MDAHARIALLFVMAFAFAALWQATSAANVNIVEPYNATVQNGGSIYLGKVGPGQTFYVTISSATRNSTGTLLESGWNKLIATGKPSTWIVQNSSLYNRYPSVKVTVAPNAQNGTYMFNMTAINVGNYSGVGSVSFTVYVNVTPDVFRLGVSPQTINAGIGQPARVFVTINNTGVSDTPFEITVRNLPAWNRSSTVIALHHTEQKFVYSMYEDEPGVYHVRVYVNSTASPLIFKQENVTLTTHATVLNDYRALGYGTLTFPVVYEPVYAVMHLISLLFKS